MATGQRSTSSRQEDAKTERTRIVIADDHRIFREGLKTLLKIQPDFEVVGEAMDGAEALEAVRRLRPDVLLLDLAMPVSGFETLRELATQSASVRILLLTASADKMEISRALQLGAWGVVQKGSPSQLLFKAIRAVMEGRYWLERESVADLVQYLQGSATQARPFGLTERELEVVEAVVAGLSNREIGRKLAISEQTAKHHLTNIFDKVGVSNRLELALLAIKQRLIGS